MGAPVFICYKREEKSRKFVEQLVKKLKARDIESWHDQKIRGSDEWRKEIDNAIEACAVVIVVVTTESMKSQYATYEWSYAMGRERIIIPAFLDGANDILHPKLEPVQYREFRRQFEEEWDELIDDVAEAIGKAKLKQVSGEKTPEMKKLSNRDKALIEEFLVLFPRKRIQHLKTADPHAKPSPADETGKLKLDAVFNQLIEFADRPHIKAVADKTLQTLLIDSAKKLLRLQPKDWSRAERTSEDRPLNFIGGFSFNSYNAMKAAYDKLLTYILENYPEVSVTP